MYSKVSWIALRDLYRFLKISRSSKLSYTFEDYFKFRTESLQIKVLSHHFSARKIEGLTFIDKLGVSLSFERENPEVRQNFTKCHELGHVLLKHKGQLFTELRENQDNVIEREANVFASVILMPDIVLLSKICYQRLSFEEVHKSLKVSSQALEIRLIELFQNSYYGKNSEIVKIIDDYKNGDDIELLQMFKTIEDDIILAYESIDITLEEQIIFLLNQNDFVTSRDFIALGDINYLKEIKSRYIDLDYWYLYDRGKSIGYVWKKDNLTKSQAQLKANAILLLEME